MASMPLVLAICADCERRVLHQPRRAQALAESLADLVGRLRKRRRLADLEVVREACRHACPQGRICVTLRQEGRESCHHLGPGDDLQAVARKLTARRSLPASP